jgi:hypothetical protein
MSREPITLPPERGALLRANLLDAIERDRSPARTSRRIAVAGVLALIALLVGAVTAVGGGIDFLGALERHDEQRWTPPEALPIGPRAELERGEDWSFVVWATGEGACVAYAAGSATSYAIACGRPHQPRGEGPEHLITLLVTPGGEHKSADGRGAIAGSVTSDVPRVELELVDGRVVTAYTREAPSAVKTSARFFLVRVPLEFRDPRRGAALPTITFYADDGRRLERFEFGRRS